MTAEPLANCWCGGTMAATPVKTATFRLVRCASCGTYMIDPPPITAPEQSGEFYSAYYAGRAPRDAPAAANARLSRFWRVVEQAPELGTPIRTVIDFGSGDGQLCGELAKSGWTNVVGLDLSRTRIEEARRRFPAVRFYDRPIQDTDLTPGMADLCVMDNVIEHLVDPADTLAGLKTYLRSSGTIVVITPNMESGQFRFLGKRWTPELAPHAHIFLFTAASLRRALERAGFVVETVGTFQDEPYPLRRWLGRIWAGDIKGAAWRAHQELGALYARWTGAGPMLYAIARAMASPSPPRDATC